MTFEGWTHQWAHELALRIDNDQELLRRMRELVGEIIDRDWSLWGFAALTLLAEIDQRLGIDTGYKTGADLAGWIDLLEHYKAQVLEERQRGRN